MIDFSELISLGITVENLGVETATDLLATLSSESEYITFTDDTEDYGELEAGSELFIADAFSFEVADDIPDMTSIPFLLTITGAEDSWEASFNISAHAPAFSMGTYMIADDIVGNSNGRLDPGETARIIVNVQNVGSCSAFDVLNELILNNSYVTVNDDSYLIPELTGGSQAFFEISVSPTAPIGTVIEFSCLVSSGAYTAEKSFVAKVGLILEDFETGDFTAFEWTQGGNQPWLITEDNVYEGSFSAKSGDISHNQSSELILQYEASIDDSISFFCKVSSESGYDWLRFYIDNNQKAEWSGNVDWNRVAYAVPQGEHTFKWVYSKDVSVDGGDDMAMIDYIIFPASVSTTGWAGNDAAVCEGEDYQLDGFADYYNELEWITSGTGTFDDPTILNPVYTPGSEDISAGSVELTLIVTGESSAIESSMILTINPMSVADAGEPGFICQDEYFEITSAYAENYSALTWETSGTGSFTDPSALNPVYVPSADDYVVGMVSLTLTAQGIGSCGDAVSSTELSFYSLPTALLTGDQSVCQGEEAQLTITLTGEAPWTVEMAEDMGTIEIFDTPYTMVLIPEAPMEMSLLSVTDGNGCINTGEGSAAIDLLYPPAAPLSPIVPDSVDYAENTVSVVTIEAVEGATAYEWAVVPAEAGTFEGEGLEVNINWNTSYIGEAELMARAQNECGWSDWSPAATVVLESSVGLNENFAKSLVVYPNPSNGEVYLSLDYLLKGKVNLTVANSLGKLVYESEMEASAFTSAVKLPISHLENGVYLIRITSADGQAVKPLFINK
ncbi:MAG TPA: T9SS type A sorting domain-containing protein [Bacteroidales bacterium]|nr:T9SS type A sorting domain-containing protein [Bacteroidales bacterium]